MIFISSYNFVPKSRKGLPEEAPGITFDDEAVESSAESPFDFVGGQNWLVMSKFGIFYIFFTFFRLFESFSFVFSVFRRFNR